MTVRVDRCESKLCPVFVGLDWAVQCPTCLEFVHEHCACACERIVAECPNCGHSANAEK